MAQKPDYLNHGRSFWFMELASSSAGDVVVVEVASNSSDAATEDTLMLEWKEAQRLWNGYEGGNDVRSEVGNIPNWLNDDGQMPTSSSCWLRTMMAVVVVDVCPLPILLFVLVENCLLLEAQILSLWLCRSLIVC